MLNTSVCSPHADHSVTWEEKWKSRLWINSIRETNEVFDSCRSCKLLGPSRLHKLHQPRVSNLFVLGLRFFLTCSRVYSLTAVIFSGADRLCPSVPISHCVRVTVWVPTLDWSEPVP